MMLFLRGLLVVIAGFLFVFLPGGVIAGLTKRDLRYDSSLMLWGMGILLVTLFPALLIVTLFRRIMLGENEPQQAMVYVIPLVGTLITSLFLVWGTFSFLRWRKVESAKLLDSGMAVGIGVGLITNVFQGMALIGSGFRLIFGDTSMPDLKAIANQAWPNLIAGLVALNIYRVALVAISAVMGALAARALLRQQSRWVWLAVAVGTFTAWSYAAIGLALGADSLIGAIAAIAYEGILAAIALRWLVAQIEAAPREASGKRKRAAAADAT